MKSGEGKIGGGGGGGFLGRRTSSSSSSLVVSVTSEDEFAMIVSYRKTYLPESHAKLLTNRMYLDTVYFAEIEKLLLKVL